MPKRIGWVFVVGFCALVAVFLFGRLASSGSFQLDSGYRLVMGTFSQIVVVAPDAKTARRCIEVAFESQERIDTLMSTYREDSELNRVNRFAHVEPVPVDGWTFEVIERALQYSRQSDGAFDVTVGPLVQLWRAAADANSFPDEADLAAARQKVGYEKLILDPENRTVRFQVDGMELDLGGIAKGYAIDKSVEVMKQAGAIAGMVDIGGDIRCFGRPKGRPFWRIGLQDPNQTGDGLTPSKPVLVLRMQDAAIATSGHYRRFALIEGQRHSHIIDSHAGRSAGALASVSIVASDATTADALATAVSVMGADKGLALIEGLAGTEAILIVDEAASQIIRSSGADVYVE